MSRVGQAAVQSINWIDDPSVYQINESGAKSAMAYNATLNDGKLMGGEGCGLE